MWAHIDSLEWYSAHRSCLVRRVLIHCDCLIWITSFIHSFIHQANVPSAGAAPGLGMQKWTCRNVGKDSELGYKRQGWSPANSLERDTVVVVRQSSGLSQLPYSRLLRCPPPLSWSAWETRKRKVFTLGGCGSESQLLHVLALTFSPRVLKWGWQSRCHKSLWMRSWAKCFTLGILWTPTLFYRWRARGTEGWKKWPKG